MNQREQSVILILTLDLCSVAHLFQLLPSLSILAAVPMMTGLPLADVNSAINKPDYDTYPFDKYATTGSFRNFMEGFDSSLDKNECAENPLCKCEVGKVHCRGADSDDPLLRRLHNSVSAMHIKEPI